MEDLYTSERSRGSVGAWCAAASYLVKGTLVYSLVPPLIISILLLHYYHSCNMTRKKGEEQVQHTQESSMAQATRSLKEKGNQASSAMAAVAKLEKYAHTPLHSPAKVNQPSHEKTQPGGTGDRKSISKTSSTSLVPAKMANKKSPERDLSEKAPEVTLDTSEPGKPEPTLKEVLNAVNSCRGSLTNLSDQLRGLKEELRSMSQELQKAAERASILEERLSQAEDVLHQLQQEFKVMQTQLDTYKFKMDEMENRLRRHNMRVMGLPEKSEGPCPEEFLEGWLREVFGAEIFSRFFSIERAHRVPTKGATSGTRPRPLIMKLFNYKDKVTLMQKSRERGDIFYNGARISLYPDYSPELQKKRAGFADIKRSLRTLISYALQYPARLRIEALGATQFFDSADRAAKWLEDNKKNF